MKVTDRCHAATGRPAFICDYSPPRSGRAADAPAPAAADFVSAAYNPGRAVRVNPVAMAAALRERDGAETVFTLATRDMNRLALESMLLGAQALGLENVIAVAGDPFPPSDAAAAAVNDYRTTELIAAIARLNDGVDYRGRPLRAATDFCIGATVDLGEGIGAAARLAGRKVKAGAHFLITQPVYDPADAARFADAAAGVSVPVFYGVGLMEPGGVSFARAPDWVNDGLAAGRSGVDIALEVWAGLLAAGFSDCYLVPPIRRNGARNYAAATQFLERAVSMEGAGREPGGSRRVNRIYPIEPGRRSPANGNRLNPVGSIRGGAKPAAGN